MVTSHIEEEEEEEKEEILTSFSLGDAIGAERGQHCLAIPVLWWALAAVPWHGNGLRGRRRALGGGV